MKRGVYTIGSLIILLIAAFVFVLVPIFAGGKNGSRIPPFGSYDGTEIRYEQNSEFANYVARYADYYKNQGIEINNSNYYYIFNYAFNSTVTQLAYTKAVEKSGYEVPEAAINRAMMTLPYFTDENGKYSPRLYKLADKQQVADIRKDFKASLTASRFAEDYFGGQLSIGKETLYGMKSAETETAFIQDLNKDKRAFNLAVFDTNKYPESEKSAYANENAQKFTKYDFSVITCSDKTKAMTAYNSITTEKMTFDDAIGEYSQKSYSNADGKMTNRYHYQIENIVKNAADLEKIAVLEESQISEPIETSIGFTIFRADSTPIELNTDDEEILRTISNYITSNEFSRIENYFNEQGEAFAKEAALSSFKSTCEKYGASYVSVPAFPLNYGNVSVEDKLDTSLEGLSGAATNENFLKTAFSLEKNEISKPIVNGRNILVLQFIGSEEQNTDSEEQTPQKAIADEIANFDSSYAQTALLESPKLKNNMSEVFFKYIMNND